MVFVHRQLQEKYREQNRRLYATLIDLTKTCDIVRKTGLRLISEGLGCPTKYLQMVIQLYENQCDFRANRDTTDMVFVHRQLQEKCREQNRRLYATLIDLTKTCDIVRKTGLRLISEGLGCPTKYLQMVIQL